MPPHELGALAHRHQAEPARVRSVAPTGPCP